MTTSKWPGVVVRCNVDEAGDIPRTASSTSPDIIISGKEPFLDPAILTDPANYMNSFDANLDIGLPNYLYVRGRNFTDAALTGSWNLFWAPPNIVLYPSLWEQNQLATSSGNQDPPFTIKAGEIGASTDCFNWIPPDTSNQYCFVAIANTPGHGNPLAGVKSMTDLASVLVTNANIAQRNVHVVLGDIPQYVGQIGYDQGDEACTLDLAVLFENLPKGSSYSVSSATPLNGQALFHQNDYTEDHDLKYAWVDLDIPAGWNTQFDVAIKFGSDWSGISPNRFPSVTIRGELVQASSDRLYHLGYDAGIHPDTRQPRVDAASKAVRLILVGSFTTIFPDVKPKA